MTELIKSGEYSAILAQYGPNGIVSAQAAKEAGIRHVTHFHGFDLSSKLRQSAYVRDLKKLGALCLDSVVVNNEQKEILISLGFQSSLIHLIPCGVPSNKFYKGEDKRISQHCVFVGRLVPKKDPVGLLQAFKQVLAKVPEATLTIVGDGPLSPACEKFVEANELVKSVALVGSKTSEEVMEELSKAQIYLQHSITSPNGDKEGWPISIAEACANGLPIISTKHAGIKDQVLHGETGYLVEEKDYGKMAEYIVNLLQNNEKAARFGAKSRAHIRETGELEDQIGKLRNVLTSN